MIKPYYETPLGKLYHGDCLEIMPELESVDLVLTDPPYGISVDTSYLKKYHKKMGHPDSKSVGTVRNDNGELDLSFLFEFKKRLIWGHPFIYDEKATGWLIWDKQPGLDDSFFNNAVEIASTTLWKGFRMVRALWSGYWKCDNEKRNGHPTQKPMRVFFKFIEKYSQEGELIIDPFLGSGTTAIACERLKRRWIGIEIEEKYCEIAAKRIEQERKQRKLF